MVADERIAAAAYHEAGHAVVAHAVGDTFSGIRISYCQEKDRWGGTTTDLNGPPGLGRAKVALAGMLAEAKFKAGSVTFGAPTDSLIEFVTTEHSEAEPGEFSIVFRDESGQPREHIFPGELYSGKDRGQFHAMVRKSVDPKVAVVGAMTILDEPSRWLAVISIAGALAGLCPMPSARELRMEGDAIRSLIQSHGL